MKAIRTCVVLALLLVGVGTAWAQLVVFDPTNYVAALERLIQLQQQYAQLVQTYQQIRAQYDHWSAWPGSCPWTCRTRYRALVPAWRASVALDTYGTQRRLDDRPSIPATPRSTGYRLATQPLRDYGAAPRAAARRGAGTASRPGTAPSSWLDASTVLGIADRRPGPLARAVHGGRPSRPSRTTRSRTRTT